MDWFVPCRRGMAIGILMLLCLLWGLSGVGHARTIQWAGGQFWNVKQGTNLAPRANHFSASTNNVWVDENDFLHLKLTESNGTWYAAEVIGIGSLGYGEYRFLVENRVDLFGTNVIAGLFTFLSNTNEIDIEFTRAFFPQGSSNNALFSTQPTETTNGIPIPGNTSPFVINQSNRPPQTTHRFVWEPHRIFYQSYFSHEDPTNVSNAEIIHSFTYTNTTYIPKAPASEKVHLNLFLSDNQQAPNHPEALEMVVRNFIFIPSPLAPGPRATVSVTATIDNINFTNSLVVFPNTLNFGTVNRSPTDHRFQSNTLTCRYFVVQTGQFNSWSIQVYSDNPRNIPGLVTSALDAALPLKFNQPNFGPAAGVPLDADNDNQWSGENAVWRLVWDPERPGDNGQINPSAVLATPSEGDPSAADLEFRFAIDTFSDSPPRTYSGNIHIDLVLE